MLKPIRIFLVLLVLLVLLAVPALFVPSDGFRFFGLSIKYPSLAELFDADTLHADGFVLHPELMRIDFLIDSLDNEEWHNEVDTIIFTEHYGDTIPEEIIDTIDISPSIPTDHLTAEVLRTRLIPIQHPSQEENALRHFHDALAQGIPNTRLVRVLHFGDSQIEGDRISSFLRRRLQGRFGGGGVGLLHAVPHSHQPATVRQTHSPNWQKVLLPDMQRGGVGHSFGILGGYSIVTSPRRSQQRGGFNDAWIRFQRLGPHGASARNFSRIRVFYGYNEEPFIVSFTYGDQTPDADMIPPSNRVKEQSWYAPVGFNNFQIDFKTDASPMVFGISLETPTGIVVDNIPIRGSSGTDFTRASNENWVQIMSMLNAKLIILQFGVNLVPHIVDSYAYYENQMYNQIQALRRANPNASILLIGVSDMSRREGTRFVSYPNVEKIRDAQRNAAQRAGAAFWDCYMAMGGQNSMPAWVYANPPLAAKDFIHFTFRGSNLIAEMFYSALMADHEEYVNSK